MPHYKLTAPNGKSYHGITTLTVNRRMTGHKTAARNGSTYPLHAAIRKYGFDSFKVEVLNDSTDLAELHALETAGIARDNTMSPGGYNLTSGGEGSTGHTVSDERKLVIGSRMKDRWKDAAFSEMKRANSRDTAIKLNQTPGHRAKFAEASREYWSKPENTVARSVRLKQLHKDEPERFSAAIEKMREGASKHWSDKSNVKAQSEKTAAARARQSSEKRKDVARRGVEARAARRAEREAYLNSLPPEEAYHLRAEATAKKSAETSAGRARATPEQKEASRERYRQAALRRHAAKKAGV